MSNDADPFNEFVNKDLRNPELVSSVQVFVDGSIMIHGKVSAATAMRLMQFAHEQITQYMRARELPNDVDISEAIESPQSEDANDDADAPGAGDLQIPF